MNDVLGRLDPETIYPAVLAGRHAWAAWGLTRTVDPHHIELLIPTSSGPGRDHELAERIGRQLHRPIWPEADGLDIAVEARRVVVLDPQQPTTIQLERLAWYPPRPPARPPGTTVTVDGWPLLDETSALRHRTEAIIQHGPTLNDVRDLAGWAELKLTQAANYPSPTASTLESVLHELHRTAPDAYPAITRTIDHARRQLPDLPDRKRITAAYRQLVLAQQRISSPARRHG